MFCESTGVLRRIEFVQVEIVHTHSGWDNHSFANYRSGFNVAVVVNDRSVLHDGGTGEDYALADFTAGLTIVFASKIVPAPASTAGLMVAVGCLSTGTMNPAICR